MTIALVAGQNVGAITSPGTTLTRAFPSNLAVGSLVVVAVSAFKSTTNDPFTVSDIAQSAGTATLGPWSLDEQINENLSSGGSTYLNTAFFSAIVTGAGSCTVQVSGMPSGYSWINVNEFSGNWDEARRHVAGSKWNTQASATAPSTPSLASVGDALFVAAAATYSGANPVTYTEDGAFTSLYASTNGAADHTGEVVYRIVSGATTDSADWTAPATHGWNAVMVIYKEAGSTTKKVPSRRHFAQPQQATRINWRNPITRGLGVAINFGDAAHDSIVNLVTGNRWTGSIATAPDKGVGLHGKWQGRGNADGSYWSSTADTFAAVPCTVVAFVRDFTISGNRFVVASFNNGDVADWIGFDTTPQPVINIASSNRCTGLSTYMANDVVYGFDVKEQAYACYQRGRLAASQTGAAGTPALKFIGGISSGFSTYASRMYLFLYWSRVLSPEEHASIAADPWQVFAPMRSVFSLGGAGGGVSITPAAGVLSLTGYAPTVTVSLDDPGRLLWTKRGGGLFYPGDSFADAQEPGSFGLNWSVIAQAEGFGTLPSYTEPSAASIALVGYAPTVTVTTGVNITPGAASVTLTGYAPTVTRTSSGVTFENANSRNDADFGAGLGGNISVSPPANLAAGDLWIITACADIDAGATITMPGGWTAIHDLLIGGDNGYPGQRSFWKIAGASESAVNVTFSTGAYQCWALSQRYSNTHQTAPIGNVATTAPTGSIGTLDAPDVTIQSDGSMAVLVLAYHPPAAAVTTITQPSGTASINKRESAGLYAQGAVAYEARNAGSYTPGDWTLSAFRGNRTGVTFEIKPAGGAGSITITPPAGSISLAGYAPTLGTPSGITITPPAGSVGLSGYAPQLTLTLPPPAAGVVTLTGYAPTVTVSSGIVQTPGVASLTITGYAPTVLRGTNIAPGAGALTLAGYAPTVLRGALAQPAADSVALVGYAPVVTQGRVITPGAGAVSLTGYAPSLAAAGTVTPGAGSVVLTGYQPVVGQSFTITPPAGSITLVGHVPSATTSVSGTVQPGVGTLTLTGHAPTVTTTENRVITPPAGSVTFAGFAPAVLRSWVVVPSAAVVALTGHAPVVTVSQSGVAQPGPGAVDLIGYAPTVSVSTSSILSPNPASIAITGYAPSVLRGAVVLPNPAALALVGYPPVVTRTQGQVPSTATLTLTGYPPLVTATGIANASAAWRRNMEQGGGRPAVGGTRRTSGSSMRRGKQ